MHETINESAALIRHGEQSGTLAARRTMRTQTRGEERNKKKKKKEGKKRRKRRKVWSKVTTFLVLFGSST